MRLRKPAGMVLGLDFSGERLTSPTGLTGTLRAGAAISAGNRFVTLDGTDDQVTFATDASLMMPSAFSLLVWFRPSSPSGTRIFLAKWNAWDGNYRSYYFRADYASNRYEFSISRDGTATGPLAYNFNATVPTTGWHHAALVYDNSAGANNRAKLFVDGASVSMSSVSSDTSATPYAGAQSTSSGGYGIAADTTLLGGTACWKGDLTGASIYNRAITTPEIAQIYNAGAARIALGGTP